MKRWIVLHMILYFYIVALIFHLYIPDWENVYDECLSNIYVLEFYTLLGFPKPTN